MAVSKEKIDSFFQDSIPKDFTSGTRQKAKHILGLFAEVWDDMLDSIQEVDNTKFKQDNWENDKGRGVMALSTEGKVFSKIVVGISMVTGKLPMDAINTLLQAAERTTTMVNDHSNFLGLSFNCIAHSNNPHVPSSTYNIRFVVMKLSNGEQGWYGGVMDLTPSYLVREDATHFHKTLKDMCDKHDTSYYPRFKKRCDEYFYIPHHGETRGIGGIFFDNLPTEENNFSFMESCGKAFMTAYLPIVKKHMNEAFTDEQVAWKQRRNARYIEFNLMLDNGMKFGFQLPGFKKEILFATLPLTASWHHKSDPEPSSTEHKLLCVLRDPKKWA